MVGKGADITPAVIETRSIGSVPRNGHRIRSRLPDRRPAATCAIFPSRTRWLNRSARASPYSARSSGVWRGRRPDNPRTSPGGRRKAVPGNLRALPSLFQLLCGSSSHGPGQRRTTARRERQRSHPIASSVRSTSPESWENRRRHRASWHCRRLVSASPSCRWYSADARPPSGRRPGLPCRENAS